MANTEENDFLLHLYDKLWDNITVQEGRLWTFLSVYGAVTGLALSSDTFRAVGIPGFAVVLILTFWAIQIVLNADWWAARNRLMISGIELRFPEAVRGVVPSRYREPSYRPVRLHTVSIVVFALIGFLVYVIAVAGYCNPRSIDDWSSLLELLLLLFLITLFAFLSCRRDEYSIYAYFQTYTGLRNERNVQQDADDRAVGQQERADRKRRVWFRVVGAMVTFVATFLFDAAYFVNAASGWHCLLIIGILVQVVAIAIFALFTRDYLRPIQQGNENRFTLFDSKDNRLIVIGCLFFGSLILVIVPVLASTHFRAHGGVRMSSTKATIVEIQARLGTIEKKAIEWQRETQNQKLASYIVQHAREVFVADDEVRLGRLEEHIEELMRVRTGAEHELSEEAKSTRDELKSIRRELELLNDSLKKGPAPP
jgi:hypothetical protein